MEAGRLNKPLGEFDSPYKIISNFNSVRNPIKAALVVMSDGALSIQILMPESQLDTGNQEDNLA